uniref:Transcription termination/antitermination protein NusA n=1 Tax=candidate division CPR3 bacterium TaxID=2268181 RepID=A0A7C5URJ0_UNCC3
MAVQSDVLTAIYQIADERGLSKEQVIEIIKEAVLAAYKKMFGDEGDLTVEIDEQNGKFSIFSAKSVVKNVKDEKREISVENARKIDKSLKIGDTVLIDVTPKGFGRIAAQVARYKIVQDIKEAEREMQIKKLRERVGQIVTGTVQRAVRGVVEVEVDHATALMPEEEQIPGEFYKSGTRMRFLLKEIKEYAGKKHAIVSRRDNNFLIELFKTEVPELSKGIVQIKGIAREAGSRTKVAVYSLQEKIDPIGACVGPKGSRRNAICSELGKEKIDIVVWDEDPATYIKNALQPATCLSVKVDKKNKVAKVLVEKGSLSLAIGKEGQNSRLAAKLTGYKIDITDDESIFEGKSDLGKKSSKEQGKSKKKIENKNKKELNGKSEK